MKKIIDGKLYNTATAEELGFISHGQPGSFEYFCESLYRTRNGSYFIHGEGGGNSNYGVWEGNSGGTGETIIPYSLKDAKLWAGENLDGDEYISIFGEPEEA
jgi:hypothetical protein